MLRIRRAARRPRAARRRRSLKAGSRAGKRRVPDLLALRVSQLRGELRRREYAWADIATELLLQLKFGIGTHGAHSF